MKLVLLRHGESKWNLENKFTGWTDVELTEKGEAEAKNAGELINNENINIDLVFTSVLKRAINTMNICLSNMDHNNPQIFQDWRLNERHYGSLQGLNKSETAEKYGDDQVLIWRRSYDIQPPDGESLKDTYNRCIPYFKKIFNLDENILISAHGNSIRAIVKYLFNLSEEDILKTEIGWCEPWVFTFDENKIKNFKILHFDEQSNSNLPISLDF